MKYQLNDKLIDLYAAARNCDRCVGCGQLIKRGQESALRRGKPYHQNCLPKISRPNDQTR